MQGAADPEQPVNHPRGLAGKQALSIEAWTLIKALGLAFGVFDSDDLIAPALWPALKGRRSKKQDVIGLVLEPQMAFTEEKLCETSSS